MHETSHIKRRDLLVGLLQRAALVIYWWNPLVHRVSAALTQTREQICDDLVTQHTRHADGYAALIVEFASRVVNRSIAAPVLGVTDGSTKDLTLRIRRLLRPERNMATSLNARMKAVAIAFTLTLLLSLAGTTVHVAMAKSPAEGGREHATSKIPPDDAGKQREKTVRIVDESGKPVVGATIVPSYITTKHANYPWHVKGIGGSELPILTTDANGKVAIQIPRFAVPDEKIVPLKLICSVKHPDFAETSFNEVTVTDDVLEDVATIVAKRGAQVDVAAFVGDQLLPMDRVYALLSTKSPADREDMKVNTKGWLQLPRLPAGEECMRMAYFPEDGPARFSEVRHLQLFDGDRFELRFEMKPSVSVNGRLDEGVPRPIKNGRVVAVVGEMTAGRYFLEWHAWAKVKEDGSFKLEGLPQGELEVIALCDGYIAESGARPDANRNDEELNPDLLRPQVFTIATAMDPITLKMTRTSDCQIHVLGPDARPVNGAKCSFSPGVSWWHGGGGGYCFPLHSTIESLTDPKGMIERCRSDQLFTAETNADGKAVVKNLPSGALQFTIDHDDLELPMGEWDRYRYIDLTPGEQSDVTVRMQRKGKQFLGERSDRN